MNPSEKEISRTAHEAHAVMEDRDLYTPAEVERAITALVPTFLSDFLQDVEEWAQGPVASRPPAFSHQLEAARASVAGAESARAYNLGAQYARKQTRRLS
jgi:hypothetical protein